MSPSAVIGSDGRDVVRASNAFNGVLTVILVDECIALCGPNRQEASAIIEHKATATALAHFLLSEGDAPEQISDLILADARTAIRAGRVDHACALLCAHRHFLAGNMKRTSASM